MMHLKDKHIHKRTFSFHLINTDIYASGREVDVSRDLKILRKEINSSNRFSLHDSEEMEIA